MRDALLALVRTFRFEVTFHISTGAADEDEEVHELAAEMTLADDDDGVLLGFQPRR